jgi:hypothetical protein
LHEADQIASFVAEDGLKHNVTSTHAPSYQRRPTEGIQPRASAFIKHLDEKQTPGATRGKSHHQASLSDMPQSSNKAHSQRQVNAEDALQACRAEHKDLRNLNVAIVPPTLIVTDGDRKAIAITRTP